jgi:hypothetical protein
LSRLGETSIHVADGRIAALTGSGGLLRLLIGGSDDLRWPTHWVTPAEAARVLAALAGRQSTTDLLRLR